MRMIRRLRWATLILSALALAGAGVGVWVRGQLVGSLPQLEGEASVSALAAPVTIERDARGVPTIRGASRKDVAAGLGFVHAQERFFQMDLLRRRAAGELAELFGVGALEADRAIRVHRFRGVAREVLAHASEQERRLVETYADGANAGLAALRSRPFEYLLLRAAPAPWKPEDTVLVALAMFVTLQDEQGRRESALGVMSDVLSPAVFEFLAPRGTEWDAPLAGEPFAQPAVPGPGAWDAHAQTASLPLPSARQGEEPDAGWGRVDQTALGSNNWAVAGAHSADGRAIVANDMHLDIGVPNIWYRASLAWPEAGSERRATGVTLPGAVSLVAGSNGQVAWGFTNSYGDFGDLVVLEPDPSHPDAYRTPAGPRRIEHVTESIKVRGAPDAALSVLQTIWGPVVDRDHRGRRRALRWAAHGPDGVNLRLLGLEFARGLDEALALAAQVGAPAQNFVCAEATGRIGWTIMGRIPRRVGFDGRLPTSWADGARRWDGWLEPDEYPRIVDPPGGRIWTANARVVEGEWLALLGDGGYDLGARAQQIRDGLRVLEGARERDMLAIQLDDRALFLSRWRDLLLSVLTPEALARDARRAEMRRLVEDWGGRASVESVGYRLVRAFRSSVWERVYAPLTAACKRADARFDPRQVPQSEGPLWALVSQRPPHLVDQRFGSWGEALLAAVDATLEELLKDGFTLAQRTWGERNSPPVQHPLSRSLPLVGRFLDMPRRPIAGDYHMPRVQMLGEGASERFAVSPGREGDGYLHMPAGQSGHPLSPHYRDGHDAWLRGEPTPFLPGPALHVLTLRPAL